MKKIAINIDPFNPPRIRLSSPNSSLSAIWQSSNLMSALFLGEVFYNLGYEIFILYKTPVAQSSLSPSDWISPIYPKFHMLEEGVAFTTELEFQIIFQLGYFYDKKVIAKYRHLNPNVKIVAYITESFSISDMEYMIYTENNLNYHGFKHLSEATFEERKNFCRVDQIWILPQHEKTSLEYLQFYLNCAEVTVVPYIWSATISTYYAESEKLSSFFVKSASSSSNLESRKYAAAIVEPNISLTRSCIIPVYICERYNRQHQNLANIYILNGKDVGKHRKFLQVIDGTSIRNLCSAEDNFQILKFLNKYADVIVSHQWHCPINHIYFETAWWGWPIIHNGELCKDIGYYYSDFNVSEGTKALERVIDKHASFAPKYLKVMRKRISRYLPETAKLLEDYQILVQDLLFDRFKKWTYDATTNSLI